MIGRTIRKLRLDRDLTQEALAEKAGISPTTVGNIETGRTRNPDRGTIESIADALGVDVGVLAESGAASGGSMGQAIPGAHQVPVGYSVAVPEMKSDNLQTLQLALAQLCSLEVSGKVTTEEREAFQRVVARLEGHRTTNQD